MRGRRKFLGHLLGLLSPDEVFCRSPARQEAGVFQLSLPNANTGLLGTLGDTFPLRSQELPRKGSPALHRQVAPFSKGTHLSHRRWGSCSATETGRSKQLGPGILRGCGCAGPLSFTPAPFCHAFHPRPFPAPYVG